MLFISFPSLGGLFSSLSGGFGSLGGFLGLGERKEAAEKEFGRREGDIAFTNELLKAQAQGTAPSAAQEALRQGTGQAISGATAVQASARPGQQGLAARMAAQTQGRLGSEISGQGALLALEEQSRARQMLADFIARLKAADVQAGAGMPPGAGEQLAGAGAGLAGAALNR
jgi:hypothetical protein